MIKIYRIYKCINEINGKTYIGFTHKTLAKRIIEHKSSERNLKRYSDPEKRKVLSDAIKLSWQKRKQQSIGV